MQNTPGCSAALAKLIEFYGNCLLPVGTQNLSSHLVEKSWCSLLAKVIMPNRRYFRRSSILVDWGLQRMVFQEGEIFVHLYFRGKWLAPIHSQLYQSSVLWLSALIPEKGDATCDQTEISLTLAQAACSRFVINHPSFGGAICMGVLCNVYECLWCCAHVFVAWQSKIKTHSFAHLLPVDGDCGAAFTLNDVTKCQGGSGFAQFNQQSVGGHRTVSVGFCVMFVSCIGLGIPEILYAVYQRHRKAWSFSKHLPSACDKGWICVGLSSLLVGLSVV